MPKTGFTKHLSYSFLRNPFDLGARIARGAVKRERALRDWSDPPAFSDNILDERHRFLAEGTHYIFKFVNAYVSHATSRSRALTDTQTVCITFFAMGTDVHSVGDAENLSENTVCTNSG